MLSYSPSSFIEMQLTSCISLSDVTYIDHVTITTIDLVKIHHPCFPTFTCHPEKTVVLSSSELSKGYNSVVCRCTRLRIEEVECCYEQIVRSDYLGFSHFPRAL